MGLANSVAPRGVSTSKVHPLGGAEGMGAVSPRQIDVQMALAMRDDGGSATPHTERRADGQFCWLMWLPLSS